MMGCVELYMTTLDLVAGNPFGKTSATTVMHGVDLIVLATFEGGEFLILEPTDVQQANCAKKMI